MREGVSMGANADFDEDELDEEEKFAQERRRQRVKEGNDEDDESEEEENATRGNKPNRNRRNQHGEEDEDANNDLLREGALSSFVGRKGAGGRGGGAGLFGRDDDDDTNDARDRDTMIMVTDPKTGKFRVIPKIEREKEVDEERRVALAERLLKRGANLTPGSLNEAAAGSVIPIGGKRGRDGEVQDYENDEIILRYGKGADDKRVQAHLAAQNRGAGSNAAALAAAQTFSSSQTAGGGRSGAVAYAKAQFLAKQQEKRDIKRSRFEDDIKKGEEYEGKNNSGLGDVKRGGIDPYAYVPLDRRFMNKRHRVHGVRRFESVVNKGNLKGGKASKSQ